MCKQLNGNGFSDGWQLVALLWQCVALKLADFKEQKNRPKAISFITPV
jgi:hypothetical protein